jgi:hypothetical protein
MRIIRAGERSGAAPAIGGPTVSLETTRAPLIASADVSASADDRSLDAEPLPPVLAQPLKAAASANAATASGNGIRIIRGPP